jgi:hypothetical protein
MNLYAAPDLSGRQIAGVIVHGEDRDVIVHQNELSGDFSGIRS